MENQQNAVNAQVGLSAREKFWTERDATEKVEALRRELVHAIQRQEGLVALVERLLEHGHSASGVVMTPVNRDTRPYGYSSRVSMALRDKE